MAESVAGLSHSVPYLRNTEYIRLFRSSHNSNFAFCIPIGSTLKNALVFSLQIGSRKRQTTLTFSNLIIVYSFVSEGFVQQFPTPKKVMVRNVVSVRDMLTARVMLCCHYTVCNFLPQKNDSTECCQHTGYVHSRCDAMLSLYRAQFLTAKK